MKTLDFKVDGTRLSTKSGERVTTGNIEFVKCNFQFDASWDALVKTAVFYQPRTPEAAVHMILDANDSCYMPLLKQTSELHVGVFGIAGDIRATTNFCIFAVIPGSYIEGMGPAEPSRDVYEQLLQQVAESLQGTRENAAAAAQSAANAKDSENASSANVQLSADQAERAKAEADRSEAAADRASEIAGGDVVTKTELTTALTSKIDTVPTAPAGNVPVFDDNGQIVDSGRSASSIGDGNVKSINSQTPDDTGNVAVNTLAVGDTEPTDPNVVEWIDTSDDAEIKALEEIGAVVQIPNPVAGNVAVLTDKGGIADGGAALSDLVGGLQDVNVQLENKANLNNANFVGPVSILSNMLKVNPTVNSTTQCNMSYALPSESTLFATVRTGLYRNLFRFYEDGGSYRGAFIDISNCANGVGSQLATATPPQEYDLPLVAGAASGGGGKNCYWKNQFGEVGFTISIVMSSDTMSRSAIATFPTGFRPYNTKIYIASWASNAERNGGNSINVNSNGTITYYGSTIPAGALLFGHGNFIQGN